MNLKQIECFNALAKTLNFVKAAESVYITQPAFSRMIASMEEELGCKLMERSKINPRLTIAGERIYENTKRIQEEYEVIKTKAELAKSGKLGKFRVGILTSGLTNHSSQVLRAYKDEFPHVNFELKEYSEVDLCRALEEDLVDVAHLLHSPEVYQEKYEYMIMEKSEICLLVSESHPLASKTELLTEELINEPFVVLKQEQSELGYNQMMNISLKAGFVPQVAAHADSISSLLYYVKCGVGVAYMSDKVMEFAGDSVRCIPLKGQQPCHHMYMWKKDNKQKELKEFLEIAKRFVS